MYKYLTQQQVCSQRTSIMVHLPVMKGWLKAWDTFNLLSGSKTKILSMRSLKVATIFISSPGDPEINVPKSLGLIFTISLLITCNNRVELTPFIIADMR